CPATRAGPKPAAAYTAATRHGGVPRLPPAARPRPLPGPVSHPGPGKRLARQTASPLPLPPAAPLILLPPTPPPPGSAATIARPAPSPPPAAPGWAPPPESAAGPRPGRGRWRTV